MLSSIHIEDLFPLLAFQRKMLSPLHLDNLSALLSFVLVTFGGYVFYQCYLSPLASIPGPFLATFTAGINAWSAYKGRLPQDILEQHRKYGSVVRVGPNHLYASNLPILDAQAEH